MINYLLLLFNLRLSYQATLITPVQIQKTYTELCVSDGICCTCSRLNNCDSNNACNCGVDGETQYYGDSCLLTYAQSLIVKAQQKSGADETAIASFSTVQVYDFLKSPSTTTITLKQLQAIVDLGTQIASNTTQISVCDWYLRIIQLTAEKFTTLSGLEQSAAQSFQVGLVDLLRKFMVKRIELDGNHAPFSFSQNYYSAQISQWKDSTNFTTMSLDGTSFQTAQCEYKWRSVLIKYKFLVTLSNSIIDSFTNTTFKFNSTMTYCMFVDKNGDIYYPPSSEFHYWQYIPPYTYESLLNQSNVSALGCYQIKTTSGTYSLYYNDQECQYKAITTTRTIPICQCNEPGYTFVQAIYKTGSWEYLLGIYIIILLI